MATTKVTTGGITDATIATADIADDAVTAAKLANTSVTAASYGSSTSIPSITVDAQGRITAASGNTVNTDLVGDTSPQLGGDLASNGSDILLADNDFVKVGTGNDLTLSHNGTNSFIANNTGELQFQADDVRFYTSGASETHAKFINNGAVELYHDNSKKFETTSSGTLMPDDAKAIFGAGEDLQIYHDSSNGNSHINESGSGSLVIKATNTIINSATDEAMIAANADGAVELYHNNVKKFETVAGGVKTNDSNYMGFGNGNDLQIFHDGTHSKLVNYTGDLHLASDNAIKILGGSDTGETQAVFNNDGAVELYHNNHKKIFTEAEGASVCGDGSDVHLRLRDSSDNVRGIVHATASVDVGFITAAADAWLFRVHDDGSYQHYGSEISDRDKKDNITTISSTSLDKVTKLVPKTFTFKQDETGKVPTDKVFTGFIAQEVKEHLPNIVTGTDGQKDMAVDYNGILAHAVKAITELSAEVETLKTKVAALEAA